MGEWVQTFLLALSTLFSIINPIGSAIIFSQVTSDRTHAQRVLLARRIGIYSALVMLGALWVGAAILGFFGVSLSALRIAGGLVVASYAWALLQAPEQREAMKHDQAAELGEADDAFFPLTMPFTTGPGTISVAVALGGNLPSGFATRLPHILAASLAAIAIAISVTIAYASADRVVDLLGSARARVVSRLAAFLLLCVGTQIMLNGLTDFVRSLSGSGLS